MDGFELQTLISSREDSRRHIISQNDRYYIPPLQEAETAKRRAGRKRAKTKGDVIPLRCRARYEVK